MRKTCALLSSIGLLMLPVMLLAAPRPQDGQAERDSRPTVAISDFQGDDKGVSGLVAETLLTDLGHSDRVQTLERTEVRQAMADLDMRDGGPLTPGQVRHLGELIHASRILVGSCLVSDDQVVINARMLDTESGLSIPGSSLNVTGPRRNLLSLTHRLSQQLYRRLTGENLVLAEDDQALAPAPTLASDTGDFDYAPIQRHESDAPEAVRSAGLIPFGARPSAPLAEPDLAGFLGRLARRVSTDGVFRLAQTIGPVSRMQALTAIVKVMVANTDLASYRTGARSSTPDGAQIPMWGQPYLAAALDQGWWDATAPLRPRQAATWAFLQQIADRLPVARMAPRPIALEPGEEAPAPRINRRRDFGPATDEAYTGLVIDARDFDLKRDHSPRIVDEEGNEVYPDPKHCPSPDYVEEHGMAAYATVDFDSHRSGAHPLVIQAIGTTGPGPFDVVVSNEDARRIVEANRRTRFLWKWSVTLLVSAAN